MMEEEQGGSFHALPDTTRDDGTAGDKGEAQRDGRFHPDGHGEQLPLGSLAAGPPVSDRQAGPFASGEGSSAANGGPEPAAEDGAAGDGGASDKDGASGKAKPKKRGSFLRELPILIVIALGLALLIKTYAFQAYYIPSGSMEKTLDIGDKVLVNKIVYHLRAIHRGDIIVFNGAGSWDAAAPPTPNPLTRFYHAIIGLFGAAPGQTDYIKRVIGVPGDHVKCCDPLGRVTVNGVPLSEKPYLYPGNAPSENQFNIVVPSGHLWVMGDHRDVSDDSRDHIGYPGGGARVLDRLAAEQVAGTAHSRHFPAAGPDRGEGHGQPPGPRVTTTVGTCGARFLHLAARRGRHRRGAADLGPAPDAPADRAVVRPATLSLRTSPP